MGILSSKINYISGLEKNSDLLSLTLNSKNILTGSANSFTQCTLISLKQMNFSCRRKSLSQSIPIDWKYKSLHGAERDRNRFQDENVEVVISEDDFLKFHERSDTYIVPKVTKRIGSSGKYDEKTGCTLMVTVDMLSSKLVEPMMIFIGSFGERNQRKYLPPNKNLVLFTPSYVQTSKTTVVYLEYLKKYTMTKGLLNLCRIQ